MTTWILGWLGFVAVIGGWAHYISTIPADRVPRSPTIMFVTQSLGLVCAAASLALALGAGDVPVGLWVITVFALFMGGFFFYLYSQRRTPLGNLQVEVGSPMLAFESIDSDGNTVNSDSWRGRRILLKFFRGMW